MFTSTIHSCLTVVVLVVLLVVLQNTSVLQEMPIKKKAVNRVDCRLQRRDTVRLRWEFSLNLNFLDLSLFTEK